MKCLYCHAELVQKNVSHTINRSGYHLIIDDVPAWVCEQCGEMMFDEPVVEAMQKMVEQMDAQRALVPALTV